MFTILVLLLNATILAQCQICNLNVGLELHVVPNIQYFWKWTTINYLAFICPPGFLQNSTHCILLDTSQPSCPLLETLNLEYNITACTTSTHTVSKFEDLCAYRVSQFLATGTENNIIKLVLSTKSESLYLDVHGKKSLHHIEDNLHCWVRSTVIKNGRQFDEVESIEFEQTFRIHTESIKSDRYTLRQLSTQSLTDTYFCIFFKPGKNNPVVSNIIKAFDLYSDITYTFIISQFIWPVIELSSSTSISFGSADSTIFAFVDKRAYKNIFHATNALKRIVGSQIILNGKKNILSVERHKYCDAHYDSTNSVLWCQATAGITTIPCENPCLDDEGNFVTRKCERYAQSTYGAEGYWLTASSNCSKSANFPERTLYLLEKKNNFTVTPAVLMNISSIIREDRNITALDLDLISTVLSNAAKQAGTGTLKDAFFDVIDNVLNLHESVFSIAIHLKKQILNSVHQFVETIAEYPANLTYSNVVLQMFGPYSNLTASFDQMLTVDSVSVKFPVGLLREFSNEKGNFSIALTVFKSKNIFPAGMLFSDIVDIQIKNFCNYLTEPISVFIEQKVEYDEVVCAFTLPWQNTTRWSTIDIETIRSNNSRIVECRTYHLTSLGLLSKSDNFITDEHCFRLSSVQYCVEDYDAKYYNMLWCTTAAGTTTIPCKNPCLGYEGNIITRECRKSYSIGAYRLLRSTGCDIYTTLTKTTNYLRNNRNTFVTSDMLFTISSLIINNTDITALDLYYMSTILSNAVNQPDVETLKYPSFDVIDNMLNIDESVFSKAYNSRENLLHIVDHFIEKISKTPVYLRNPNLAVRDYRPYSNLTNSFDQVLTIETVAAILPVEMLRQLLQNSKKAENFTVAMTVFKNIKLFSKGIVASDVVNLIIPNANQSFTEPVSIIIENKSRYDQVVCAYWNYGENTPGYWSTIGIETIRNKDSNIVECKTYHLASIALLDDTNSEEIIETNQYCTKDIESNGVVWCETRVGLKTTPCENPCQDDEGNIITRKCEAVYPKSAIWSYPSARCSSNTIFTENTNHLLINITAPVIPETLFNISSIIRDIPNITALDLHAISTILSNAVNQADIEILKDAYFETIDNVLNIDESVFSKFLHSRENILYAVDQFIEKVSKVPANLTNPNLSLNIYTPYSNLTDSFDQAVVVNRVAAIFPMEMLQQLLLNSNEKENFTVSMTVFKNRKLFPEGTTASDIIDLIIPNTNKSFTQPISIFFELNSTYDRVACAYWNYGKNTPGNWSTNGIETIRKINSNIVECKTYHLTSFVLLEIGYDDNGSEEVIVDNKYCMSDLDIINGVRWCSTSIGTTTIPCEYACLDDDGCIITRKCENELSTGPRWSDSSARCSANTTLSDITSFLLKVKHDFMGPAALSIISSVIRDTPSITALDLDSISTILSNAANQTDTEILKDTYFDAIDSVLNIGKSVFSKAFHSREGILFSLDQFVEKMSLFPANFSYQNFDLKMYRPYSTITDTFEQVLTVEGVSAKFSMDMLLKLYLHSRDKDNFFLAMTVFKNTKLFPEGTMASDIAHLIKPYTNLSFTHPIRIFLKRKSKNDNVVCAYWNYSNHTIGNWSTIGIETIRSNDSNIVECKTLHLTSVVLLEVPIIVSNQYCMEDFDTINGVVWCKTSVGITTIPCKTPCLNDEGFIITRKCQGDFLTPAKWSHSFEKCSAHTKLSETSVFLQKVKNDFLPPATMTMITSVIRNIPNITALDLNFISTILSNAVHQSDTESLKDAYFDAVDNVLNIDESLFSKALHSRENILYSLQQFIEKISKLPANISYTNFALKIYRPYLHLTDTFDQVLRLESVAAKFPIEILQNLFLNSHEKENFTIAMTVFKNRQLFPEGIISSDIADLIIPNTTTFFHQPISIFIRPNSNYDQVVCAYWNFGKNTPGYWSTTGIETIKIEDSNIIECKTYHLSSFALVEIPDTVIEGRSTPIYKQNLQYIIISTTGCLFSAFGMFITLYTAFACKNWYKGRFSSLLLSFVVFCEVIMLVMAETFNVTDNGCAALGAIMHCLVLIKFWIMLLIVQQQHSNFVNSIENENISQHNLIHIAIAFTVPFILVSVAANIFPDTYNIGNLNVCYPKHEGLIYFLVIPISLIQLVIMAVFGLIWVNISKNSTMKAKEMNSKVKFAFMLWFMLILVWLFGILAEIVTISWLQITFVYGFSILAPLQGFVVFWFTVITDKYAMVFWRTKLALSTNNNASNTEYNLVNINNNHGESASKNDNSENETLLSGTNSKTNRISATLPTHSYIPFVSKVEL